MGILPQLVLFNQQLQSSLEARLARCPFRSRALSTSPHFCDMLCFPSSFPSIGWVLCVSLWIAVHPLILTSARSMPAALPKPIIISVSTPHYWKGSTSKPYMELPLPSKLCLLQLTSLTKRFFQWSYAHTQ